MGNNTGEKLNYPSVFRLFSAYPNSFIPLTSLSYYLPEDSNVTIIIYVIFGNMIENLVNNNQSSGYKTIQWNPTNNALKPVSSRVYLFSIEAGEIR